MTKELIVGFPVNEFSLCDKLFGKPYFFNQNGGLEEWAKSMEGGFLEQHFQTVSEINRILDSPERLSEFKAKIDEYRENALEVTIPAPFLKAHSDDPDKQSFLGFDFEWLVAPVEYKDKPIKDFYVGENSHRNISR